MSFPRLKEPVRVTRSRCDDDWLVRKIDAPCDMIDETEGMRLIALGRMTACVVHDLRNFCNQARGLHYIAVRKMSEGNTDEAEKTLTMLGNAIENMAALSSDVLSLGLHKRHTYRKEPVSRIVDDFLRTLEPGCGVIPLTVHPACTETYVEMSTYEMRQIVLNLIKNAQYASGHVSRLNETLSVLIHPMRRDTDYILLEASHDVSYIGISVCDTGHGMSEEVLERIAEPAFTTKGDDGNGLGLFMSARLAKLYDGALVVRTKEHGGTKVTLCLPTITNN